MSKNTYYCITDDDCKYTTMTAEQIVTAIEQAVETGAVTDPDGAVISKIKEIRANDAVQIWKGTQAQFNALSPAPTVGNTFIRVGTDGVLYVCTDDEQMNALLDHIADTSNPHSVTLDQVLNGNAVPVADGGTGATTASGACANLGIVNLIYPVGSIYMSVNSTNPATLFGGTWSQLKDRFLLGAGSSYSAGATGGAATHTLTAAQMPSHTHVQNGNKYTPMYSDNNGSNTGWCLASQIQPTNTGATEVTTNSTGSGQAHNNMPPYLVVYMWKRTA